MKANREYIKESDSSFYCYRLEQPKFDFIWHYHPEYEISYVERGTGQRIVGDSFKNFYGKDLFMVGSNVPHTLNSRPGNEDVILYGIQFAEDFFVDKTLSKQEFKQIAKLLEFSKRGVGYDAAVAIEIGERVKEIYYSDGLERYFLLLRLLDYMGQIDAHQTLVSADYNPSRKDSINSRYGKVCRYIHANYQTDINLDAVALVSDMTPTSFCRFFKKVSGKSFVLYVNELRIGKACELLRDTEKSITDIAFESGFNSITHFNRVFKQIKSVTPLHYRKNAQSSLQKGVVSLAQ